MPTSTDQMTAGNPETGGERQGYDAQTFRGADPTADPVGENQEVIEAFNDPRVSPAALWNSVQIGGTDGTGESGLWQRSWKGFTERHGTTGEERDRIVRAMGFAKDLGRPHEIWNVQLGGAAFGETAQGKAQDAQFDAHMRQVITKFYLNKFTGSEEGDTAQLTPEQQAEMEEALGRIGAPREPTRIEQAIAGLKGKFPDDWITTAEAIRDVSEHGTTLGKHVTMLGLLNGDAQMMATGRAIATDTIRRAEASVQGDKKDNLEKLTAEWRAGNDVTDPAKRGEARERYAKLLREEINPTNAGGAETDRFVGDLAIAHDLSTLAERVITATRGHDSGVAHLRAIGEAAFDSRYRHRDAGDPAEAAIQAIAAGDSESAAAAYGRMEALARQIEETAADLQQAEQQVREGTHEQAEQTRNRIREIGGDSDSPEKTAAAIAQVRTEMPGGHDELDTMLARIADHHLELAATSGTRNGSDALSIDYGYRTNPAGYHLWNAAQVMAIRTHRNGQTEE